MAKKILKIFKYTVISVSVVMLIGLFLSLGTLITYKNEVQFNKELLTTCTTKLNIYDNNNQLINSASINGNKIVKLDELPTYLPECFISIEDKSFYKHNGLNYKRMLKALLVNLTSKSIKQGASTISQQLIKNTHLSNEKTIERKLKEIMLTKQLEQTCSKQEILETYLNVIYFGNSAYGIEDASLIFFNKSAKDLTLAESAGLAGVIKSPQYYSPIYNYENFTERKNLVLKNMLNDKKISKEQFDAAINEKIIVNSTNLLKHRKVFENAAIAEACAVLNCSEKDIATMGLNIYTTQNLDMQNKLVEIISNEKFYQTNRNGISPNSCMTCINSKTGAVEAFYGNGNFNFHTFKRQPGSAIKPILVYAPALENNIISPLTKIDNSAINIDGYTPQNIGSVEKKYVSVTESISESLNIPAVKVLDYVGLDKAMNFAKNNGIQFSNDDKNLNIALGGLTEGINILQLAGSYTAFANNGYYSKPYFIEKITSKSGREIYSHKQKSVRTMREDTSYLMTDMLKYATKNGTSKRLKDCSFEIAGKTGTVGVPNTNFNTDAWSVAYTSDNIICSWLGNADGQSASTLEGNNNGGTYATSMIKDYLSSAIKVYPENFVQPSSVAYVNIDAIAYEKDNQLVKANSALQDCYVMKGLFSVYNLPKESNVNVSLTNLACEIIDQDAKVTFKTYPTINYSLYRVANGEKNMLKEYKNSYKSVSFTDYLTPLDIEFYYLLEYELDGVIQQESTDNFYISSSQKKWFM